MKKEINSNKHIVVFSDHKIRRVFHEDTWWGGSQEYAILTAEISKARFGLTPSEYKALKGLDRENLRDHMTDLELIFSMLGEASTTEIARNKDAQGFAQNKSAAREGGEVAGAARKDLEKRSSKKVTTSQNYLDQTKMQIEDV